jgi:hypothetical protein
MTADGAVFFLSSSFLMSSRYDYSTSPTVRLHSSSRNPILGEWGISQFQYSYSRSVKHNLRLYKLYVLVDRTGTYDEHPETSKVTYFSLSLVYVYFQL